MLSLPGNSALTFVWSKQLCPDFSAVLFPWLVNQSLTSLCEIRFLQAPGFGGSFTSTLQSEVRVPWHGSAPSVLRLRLPTSSGSARFGPPYRDRMEL